MNDVLCAIIDGLGFKLAFGVYHKNQHVMFKELSNGDICYCSMTVEDNMIKLHGNNIPSPKLHRDQLHGFDLSDPESIKSIEELICSYGFMFVSSSITIREKFEAHCGIDEDQAKIYRGLTYSTKRNYYI